MDDRKKLLLRIEKLESLVSEQAAIIAEQKGTIAEQKARIEELELELRRRGKNYRPKGNVDKRVGKPRDRRGKRDRKHPGQTRAKTPPTVDAIPHEVHMDHCPFCGGEVDATGEYDDVYVEDVSDPSVEVHRYRRHVYKCRCCQKKLKVSIGASKPARDRRFKTRQRFLFDLPRDGSLLTMTELGGFVSRAHRSLAGPGARNRRIGWF